MANLRVNGQERAYDGDPSMPLLWYLRDELGSDGHQVRLRRRAVRQLHRARRRQRRALVRDAHVER